MSSSTVTLPTLTISSGRPLGKTEAQFEGRIQLTGPRLGELQLRSRPFQSTEPIKLSTRMQARSVICASVANARCSAEQTQTVTRQQTTITIAPIQGKEKSPDLDDGGDGFPPRDDGDGGGGGGGGGGWSGGFFFFGFLAFLGFLKDQESDGPYRDERRR